MTKTPPYRCPQCHKAFSEKTESFPFCGKKCATLDLGAWAAERYRVPGESVSPEQPGREDEEDPVLH